MTYLVGFNAFLYTQGGLQAILFGFLIPYVLWNYLMGFTVYMQHTNPQVPWFNNPEEWMQLQGQEDVTPYIKFPRWYGWISHDNMEHPAHHVYPLIPGYHLYKAQQKLNELLGDRILTVKFTPMTLLRFMKTCKLYDYENHRLLNFKGEPTSGITLREDFMPDFSDARPGKAAAAA